MDEQQLTATAHTSRPIDPCPTCSADVDNLQLQHDGTWTAHPCGHRTHVTMLPTRVRLTQPSPDACDYCNRDDVTLYAWHADTWCETCMLNDPRATLALVAAIDNAPLGRPKHPTYDQPFVWQTPDGTILRGERRSA